MASEEKPPNSPKYWRLVELRKDLPPDVQVIDECYVDLFNIFLKIGRAYRHSVTGISIRFRRWDRVRDCS